MNHVTGDAGSDDSQPQKCDHFGCGDIVAPVSQDSTLPTNLPYHFTSVRQDVSSKIPGGKKWQRDSKVVRGGKFCKIFALLRRGGGGENSRIFFPPSQNVARLRDFFRRKRDTNKNSTVRFFGGKHTMKNSSGKFALTVWRVTTAAVLVGVLEAGGNRKAAHARNDRTAGGVFFNPFEGSFFARQVRDLPELGGVREWKR